jgi:uncharacterized Zn finger protein (UPF0148 family)
MNCESCGGPLECYEGELFCPACTRYETEKLARQADDEARAARLALAQAARPDEATDNDGPPF